MKKLEEIAIVVFVKTTLGATLLTIDNQDELSVIMNTSQGVLKNGQLFEINNIKYTIKEINIEKSEFPNFNINDKEITVHISIILE